MHFQVLKIAKLELCSNHVSGVSNKAPTVRLDETRHTRTSKYIFKSIKISKVDVKFPNLLSNYNYWATML
jgi:hypothetical protein